MGDWYETESSSLVDWHVLKATAAIVAIILVIGCFCNLVDRLNGAEERRGTESANEQVR